MVNEVERDLGLPLLDKRKLCADLRHKLWELAGNDEQKMIVMMARIKKAYPGMALSTIVRFINNANHPTYKTYLKLAEFYDNEIEK